MPIFSLVLAILRLSSTRELSFELFYGVREIQKIKKKHRNHGYEKREWKKNILRVEDVIFHVSLCFFFLKKKTMVSNGIDTM